MSEGGTKEGWFGQLSTIEVLLSILVPAAACVALLIWTVELPLKQPGSGIGVIELRENPRAIVAAAVFSVLALVFGIAVLIRRRRLRKLTLAALVTGFVGLYVCGIGPVNATKSVVIFTPTDVTVSAPQWLGGETQARFIFAQIEWLRERETMRWERDWVPRRVIGRLMMGETAGWRRITLDERFIKVKGGEETEVNLTGFPRGAWHEIFKALQAAGVAIKPIERNALPDQPE